MTKADRDRLDEIRARARGSPCWLGEEGDFLLRLIDELYSELSLRKYHPKAHTTPCGVCGRPANSITATDTEVRWGPCGCSGAGRQ